MKTTGAEAGSGGACAGPAAPWVSDTDDAPGACPEVVEPSWATGDKLARHAIALSRRLPCPTGLDPNETRGAGMTAGQQPAAEPSPPVTAAEPAHDPRQERDDLFALVAHELRNPLHALSLQLALARATAQSNRETATQPHLVKAQRLLARYSERVTVLLDLVTLQAGAFPVRLQPADLAELLGGVADSLAQDAAFRGVELALDLVDRVVAATDTVLLEQVVDNLVLNALKHSGGQQVLISLRREVGRAVLSVADDGHGIAPGDQARIFGKFGVATNTPRGSGTGLGLWIVRKLVDALGGELTLTSSPGAGATFTVALPLTERPEGTE